jgi:hypothetical protein
MPRTNSLAYFATRVSDKVKKVLWHGIQMVLICTKIGITNHDEYSLVWDKPEEEQENIPTNRWV